MFSLTPTPETAEPLTPDPAPDSVSDSGQDRRERLGRVMQVLGEGGLEAALALAQRLTRLAQADSDAVVVADIAATALAMDRAGRFVRRAVAMEERIADGALAAEQKTRDERAEKAASRQARITQRKRAVHDAVTEVIHFQERDEEATERLFDDVDDWVDAAAAELFAGDRPIGALVAQACREVGLPIDLSVWEHQDWAQEEWSTRPPGSPYTAYRLAAQANPAPDTPIWPERPIPGVPICASG